MQQSGATIYTPPVQTLPGDLGASRTNPAVPLYGTTTTTLPPGVNAITTAMIPSPEAGPQHAFANTGGYALPTIPVKGPALIMTPREQIAPLGSEVVLIASYLGNGDRLITNEKIEWALEGVGNIEKFDAGSHCDHLLFDYVKAKKVTDRYAITKTSAVYQTIDRGTPDTTDDVHLLRGQTWVSINSMKEGTTHVVAFAPNMADWSQRTDVGVVHWVDAQWIVPRLAIAPLGESRVLTTTVLRASNGQPRQGWIVRYEVLGGPVAGLGGSGAQIEEVETDFSGQATTFLTPRDLQPGTGTSTIGIQIIRPAGVDGDRRVTVGSEMVRQTWSGNPNILLNIRYIGQNEARRDQDLPYVITAENRLSNAVSGVIALPIPPLASYIRSEPPGILQGSTVLWNIDLPPNGTREISVIVRQGTAGSLWLRPEFHTGSPVTTSPPAANTFAPTQSPPNSNGGAILFQGAPANPTPVSPAPANPAPPPVSPPAAVFQSQKPTLSVEITQHPEMLVQVGHPVRFFVRITNTGTSEARNLVAFIPLPPEIDANSVGGTSEPLTVDGKPPVPDNVTPTNKALGFVANPFRAVLKIPSLSVGATAHAELQYPTIGPQGYHIVCTVEADGEQVAQGVQQIP